MCEKCVAKVENMVAIIAIVGEQIGKEMATLHWAWLGKPLDSIGDQDRQKQALKRKIERLTRLDREVEETFEACIKVLELMKLTKG